MTRRRLIFLVVAVGILLVLVPVMALVYSGIRDKAERGVAGLEVRPIIQPSEPWFNLSKTDLQSLPSATRAVFSEAFESGEKIARGIPEDEVRLARRVLEDLAVQQTGRITRDFAHEGRFYHYGFELV